MKAVMVKTVDGCRVAVDEETAEIVTFFTNLEGKKIGDWWRFESGYGSMRDVRDALDGARYEISAKKEF